MIPTYEKQSYNSFCFRVVLRDSAFAALSLRKYKLTRATLEISLNESLFIGCYVHPSLQLAQRQ